MAINIVRMGSHDADGWRVSSGNQLIGRILPAVEVRFPDPHRWEFALSGSPPRPGGVAPTYEDALAALKEYWGRWLEAAELVPVEPA